MNFERIKSLVHLAQKGRMLEIGKTAVLILLKRRKAALILVAVDASEKLKQEIEVECRRYSIPLYIFSTRNELGKICSRDEVAVVGISDQHLAEGLKKLLA